MLFGLFPLLLEKSYQTEFSREALQGEVHQMNEANVCGILLKV